MKRLYVGFLLTLVTIGSTFAIDTVQFEVLQRFPNGEGDGEFRHHEAPGGGGNPTGPTGLDYENGTLYITDNLNNRIVQINDDGTWHLVQGDIRFPGEQLLATDRYLFDFGFGGSFQVFDLELKQLLSNGQMRAGFPEVSYYRRTLIAGDMILVEPAGSGGSEPRYFGFYIPDDFDGEMSEKMMGPDRTIEFLTEEYQGTERFVVDANGYVFWNGKLVAPYGKSFSQYYWDTDRPSEEWRQRVSQGNFIGWDNADNSYWSYGTSIVAVDSEGALAVELLGDNINWYGHSRFSVAPDGTLYCLSHNSDSDEFELMKLDPWWSTTTTNAAEPARARLLVPDRLAGTAVGLRSSATVVAPILAYTDNTTEVEILDRTEPQRIGVLNAPWYRVATADGTEGWVYGAFLEMQE
jgi:SH3 domain-containing protein